MNKYRTRIHRMKWSDRTRDGQRSCFWESGLFPLYNDQATRCQCRLSAEFTCLGGFKKGGSGSPVASHRQGHSGCSIMNRLITKSVHSSPHLAPSPCISIASTPGSRASDSSSCPVDRDRSIVNPRRGPSFLVACVHSQARKPKCLNPSSHFALFRSPKALLAIATTDH